MDDDHRRDPESIGNLTPADAWFGRGHIMLVEGERIKPQTIAHRPPPLAASTTSCKLPDITTSMSQSLPQFTRVVVSKL
jgi:hypothetical protein